MLIGCVAAPSSRFTPSSATAYPMDLGSRFPGSGFAIPTNPAAIQRVSPYTPSTPVPPDLLPNLIDRIRAGMSMNALNSILVDSFIRRYAHKPHLRHMLLRAQYFLYDILKELELRNMPAELALLPIIESGFKTNAFSRTSAAGIWQFIPSTGLSFDLKQDAWVDERQFTPKATQAALDYLEDLYYEFGRWDLALAAYNCGGACIRRALKKIKKPYAEITYDDLPLPHETQRYAPHLQALKEILLQPEKYGVVLPFIPNYKRVTALSIEVPVHATLLARMAGIVSETFNYLNSHLKQGIYHPSMENQILLPVETLDHFQNSLVAYKKSGSTWRVYQTKKSDTPSKIEKRFQLKPNVLRDVNPDIPSPIAPLTLLVLPTMEQSSIIHHIEDLPKID